MGIEKEAELRAITEEELTEVGARLGDEFKGNQKSSGLPGFQPTWGKCWLCCQERGQHRGQ